jgi:hypothetical protein
MKEPAPDSLARTCKAQTSQITDPTPLHGWNVPLSSTYRNFVDMTTNGGPIASKHLRAQTGVNEENRLGLNMNPVLTSLYHVTRNHKLATKIHLQLASLNPATMG